MTLKMLDERDVHEIAYLTMHGWTYCGDGMWSRDDMMPDWAEEKGGDFKGAAMSRDEAMRKQRKG